MPADITGEGERAVFKKVSWSRDKQERNLPEIAQRDKITLIFSLPAFFFR
jgi:hypothetical protein